MLLLNAFEAITFWNCLLSRVAGGGGVWGGGRGRKFLFFQYQHLILPPFFCKNCKPHIRDIAMTKRHQFICGSPVFWWYLEVGPWEALSSWGRSPGKKNLERWSLCPPCGATAGVSICEAGPWLSLAAASASTLTLRNARLLVRPPVFVIVACSD